MIAKSVTAPIVKYFGIDKLNSYRNRENIRQCSAIPSDSDRTIIYMKRLISRVKNQKKFMQMAAESETATANNTWT